MTDQTPAPAAATPHVDIRALLAQAVREGAQHKAEALKLQGQVIVLVDEITRLQAAAKRQAEEHEAALTDRDLAHSSHIETMQADIERLHQSVRDMGSQHLEEIAAAHEQARQARLALAADAPDATEKN